MANSQKHLPVQAGYGMRDLQGYGDALRWLAGYFGSTLRDENSGEILGKAFVFSWFGKIYVVGYTGIFALKIVPICSEDVRYWVFGIGFTRAEEPDFARIVDEKGEAR